MPVAGYEGKYIVSNRGRVMGRRYNAFNDTRAADSAWKAHELWMAGETAQDVARALGISVPAVYKAVALVARNPRPFRERWERYQERGER